MNKLFNILKFYISHPFNRNNKINAVLKFFKFQFAIRLFDCSFLFNWVNDSRFLITKGESGRSFGIYDNDVHKMITFFGFYPISYDPFLRKVLPLASFNKGGNTIYIKDIVHVQHRVSNSQSVRICTANDLEI